MKPREIIKALLSTLLAILVTIGIGALAGYPVNADTASSHIRRMNEIALQYPKISSAELDRIYEREGFNDVASATDPGASNTIRSILKWYVHLLGVAVFLALVLIRPSFWAAIIGVGAMSALAFLWAGGSVALAMLFALMLYLIVPLAKVARARGASSGHHP